MEQNGGDSKNPATTFPKKPCMGFLSFLWSWVYDTWAFRRLKKLLLLLLANSLYYWCSAIVLSGSWYPMVKTAWCWVFASTHKWGHIFNCKKKKKKKQKRSIYQYSRNKKNGFWAHGELRQDLLGSLVQNKPSQVKWEDHPPAMGEVSKRPNPNSRYSGVPFLLKTPIFLLSFFFTASFISIHPMSSLCHCYSFFLAPPVLTPSFLSFFPFHHEYCLIEKTPLLPHLICN